MDLTEHAKAVIRLDLVGECPACGSRFKGHRLRGGSGNASKSAILCNQCGHIYVFELATGAHRNRRPTDRPLSKHQFAAEIRAAQEKITSRLIG